MSTAKWVRWLQWHTVERSLDICLSLWHPSVDQYPVELLKLKGEVHQCNREYCKLTSRWNMIVWANVVLNRAVVNSDWIKFRQSVHLVILIVKVSCSTSVHGIKNSINTESMHTHPVQKRRDLGVGEGWEEKLKCVDGGGDEEKQNNCEIVRIEKREHQILPLQTMN